MILADNLWLLFALYAAFGYGISRIVYRKLTKRHSAYAFALLLNFSGFLSALLFVGIDFKLPHTIFPWLLAALSTGLWAAALWTASISFKHTPVSVREPIAQTELVWVFLLAVFLLGEPVTVFKVVGSAAIFCGMLLVTIHGRFVRASLAHYGVRMTLLTAVLAAGASIVDKKAMEYFAPGAYNALLYIFPGLLLLCFIRGKTDAVKNMIRFDWKLLALAGFLSASMYFSLLKAYQIADASSVYPFSLLGSVLAIFLGMYIFREERVHVVRKSLAAALIVLGALLIAGQTLW